jgi:hypothetical protein
MDKKYRIVFLGLLKNREDFADAMSRLGVSPLTVDEMIQKAPVILKRDMTLREAREYADAVQFAGGKVNIQEYGFFEDPGRFHKSLDIEPFENFTACPECGHKQLKGESCVKCGFVFNSEQEGRL